jgi:hypothetical protein
MSEKRRWNMYFPLPVADLIDATAAELGLSRTAVVRRALGIMQAVDQEKQAGRYVGSSRDREALDVVIVGPV